MLSHLGQLSLGGKAFQTSDVENINLLAPELFF